ncbi:hypothetical protein RDABS01_007091 [Bienertia sinuspersici]
MVSYGGKIQPRSHDNLLSYVGGETKILSLDRNIKFSTLFSKLCSIISPDSEVVSGFTFKYQLPGEELDALISVTNDDDLENMMHEYDRLYRGSTKPARLRLFLFPINKSGSFGSTSSDPSKIDRDSDRFVEALNSSHAPPHPPPQVVAQPPPPQVNNNVDFLFGLEKQQHQHPQHHHPVQVPVQVPVPIPAQYWQPPAPPVNVEQQPPQPPPPQHHPHQHPQFQHHQPPPPQHQQPQHPQQQQHQPPPQQQQAVYMMHAPPPANMMHAPPQMMRPPNQGYYQVQRMPDHHQQQQQQQQPQQQQQQPQQQQPQPVYNMNTGKMGGYSEGMGIPVRPIPGMAPENQGYAQVAYDTGSGRQVYYAAQQQGGGGGGGGVTSTSYQDRELK